MSLAIGSSRKRGWRLLILIFFVMVAWFLFNLSMGHELDHDEHQFVASAVLLAKQQFIPYRDYPHFHVPTLTFIYAFLFRFSTYYLLTARLFSALSAWLLCATLFFVAWQRFEGLKEWNRFLGAAGIVLFLLSNPLFIYTSGLAWNHDWPLLLTVWAFLIHTHAARQQTRTWWLLLSGFLIGIATGSRLSYATVIPLFALSGFFFPSSWASTKATIQPLRQKLFDALYFTLGLGIALLPTLWTFVLAPSQFIFGVFEYAALNTLYRQGTNYIQPITLAKKFEYLTGDLLIGASFRGNLVLLLAFLFFVLFSVYKNIKNQARPPLSFDLIFLLLLLPFLLIGSLAPSPAFPQYFYVWVPFLLLAILISSARNIPILLLVVSLSVLSADSSSQLAYAPAKWVPLEIHQLGLQLGDLTEQCKILTLAPIVPLEGGCEVYEAFTSGPFAFRVAKLLPENRRQVQQMVSATDLATFLEPEPPQAILVGLDQWDGDTEGALVQYAETHAYTALKVQDVQTLWLSPLAD